MNNISKYNKNFKYLLTVFDIFSKFAWVVPIKKKSSFHVIRGLNSVFKLVRQPMKIHSDLGKEFVNKNFKDFLSTKKISLYYTENYEIKASVIERFNRTRCGKSRSRGR